jgi:hypothetical protein
MLIPNGSELFGFSPKNNQLTEALTSEIYFGIEVSQASGL